MKNTVQRLGFALLCMVAVYGLRAEAAERPVDVYLFWGEGCPHCARAIDFTKRLTTEVDLRMHYLEVTRIPANRKVFAALVKHFAIDQPGVPLTVVGGRFFTGYHDAETTGAEIEAAVAACNQIPCQDVVQPLLSGAERQELHEPVIQPVEVPKVLKLPVFGEISPAHVSLPVLTLMLGAVDGFNPCAMWTLVFLISLLIGLRDRFRMWVLGSVFIAASAGVYFMFMAAWLNLLLWLGMLLWIRLAVGLLALGGGGYYLHEYLFNPEAVCKVTAPAKRQRVFAHLRTLVGERSFLLAAAGIILLAFAVNLVELICSAGIPAVYTQVLAMSNLPAWQYYAYLSLYILVFMLDDLVVFIVAMKTLQVTGLTGAYVRHAHAIGGAVLIAIGLMLLFKPEWLTFAV
ncbi:MAG: glutaredoxin family protein [Gammaproteobacteria bacterium]